MLRRIEGKNWTAKETTPGYNSNLLDPNLGVTVRVRTKKARDIVGEFVVLVLRRADSEGTISGLFYCGHLLPIGKKGKTSELSFLSYGQYDLDFLAPEELEGKYAEIYVESNGY